METSPGGLQRPRPSGGDGIRDGGIIKEQIVEPVSGLGGREAAGLVGPCAEAGRCGGEVQIIEHELFPPPEKRPQTRRERDDHVAVGDGSRVCSVTSVEREVSWSFPEQEAALMTLSTLFRNGEEIRQDVNLRESLCAAIEPMSLGALRYKGLAESRDDIPA